MTSPSLSPAAGGTAPPPFVHLSAPTVTAFLPLSRLITHLASTLPSLSSSIHCPPRHHHAISPSSTLLLMPSWSSDPSLPFISIKLLTSFPLRTPSLHSSLLLFSSASGIPLASLDAAPLTLLRTSAVSALASRHLSRADSSTLLLAGAGALAPFLIRAHRITRPSITQIFIWNRTLSRAIDLARELEDDDGVKVHCVEDLDAVVGIADIVSCATRSEKPLIKGKLLKKGVHLDLVGSFTPAMRECDDEAIAKGRVFVDFEVAMEEAGELVGAFERGVMKKGDVAGTLEELVGGWKEGRRSEEEVTVFKSVGAGVVDLLAAQLAYETYIASSGQNVNL